MTPDKQPDARFTTATDFLSQRLAQEQERPARLAVRTVLNLAQAPGNIAQMLSEAAAAVGERMQAAFKRHVANMTDESQAIATQLTFAEINRVPPTKQAEMIRDGKDATVVSEAAVRQRRCAPEVQAALVEHCKDHSASMRILAGRPDATLDTLAALTDSKDWRTQMYVAEGIGGRMKIEEANAAVAHKKAAIFDDLIKGYKSDYAPYLVPVCRSSEQISEMFDKTSKTLGMIEVFVENPYTPDSVLIEIASSPTMQLVRHDVARSAREILQNRAELRESSDDMAPS